jgi:hypothetical protein
VRKILMSFAVCLFSLSLLSGIVSAAGYNLGSAINSPSNDEATTLGYNNIAQIHYSTAIESFTKALGSSSTAMGTYTKALGGGSTAMGQSTIASGTYSTAMGDSTIASGDHSTAMGAYTKASNNFAVAMGRETTASGESSTAMGLYTKASGIYSTAIGVYSTASGGASIAIGYNTTASSPFSAIAIGSSVIVDGYNSVGIGLDNTPRTISAESVMAILGGKVGIGTTDPEEELDVVGNIKASGTICDSNGCIGSGVGSGIWNENDGDIYYLNGKIGIGTSSPNVELDVAGNARISSLDAGVINSNSLDVAGNAKISSLAGSGNVYVCADNEGRIYKSEDRCDKEDKKVK